MWGEVIKWGLIGVGVALAAAASWWMVTSWDGLLLNVLAPWARRNGYYGVLSFPVEVDRGVGALRKVVFRYTGRQGEKPLPSPVLVTEQILREEDLPPELRRPGTHQWTLDT